MVARTAYAQLRYSPLILAATVASHWVLDLLVHRPDLLLYPEGPKVELSAKGRGQWLGK